MNYLEFKSLHPIEIILESSCPLELSNVKECLHEILAAPVASTAPAVDQVEYVKTIHYAAKRLLEGNLFQEIVTTDSIPLKEEMKNPKVTVLSLAPMLAKIIEHVEMGLPLTYVYDMFTNKI